MRIFSFGGGVQSTAALVLAAQGRIDYKTFVFSNVGDDSEYPDTLRYIEEFAKPYAEKHGLELVTVQRYNQRRKATETLWERMTREGSRSLPIPLYFKKDGMPGQRVCTGEFKIVPVQRWLKAQGATADNPAHVGIGISIDEWTRVRNSQDDWQVLEYPLIDLQVSRDDCRRIIRDAGLPVPPKSSCFFCPFHRLPVWQELFDKHPDLFAKSVELERHLNAGRAERGKDPVYLTKYGVPLDEVVTGSHRQQLRMFAEDVGSEQHNCGPWTCTVGPAEPAA